MAYTKYSLTPANNNAAPPDGAPEGMLPSAVNDTMRDMMAQIRDVGDGIRGGTYTMTAPVITGGSINGTTIGATTASTGAFSTLSASGVATFSAGTVSAPAITTTGDTNTGIFFPAADTIAFTEGGVESMRIDSSGNVGIGTSSPSTKLDVVGAVDDGFVIRSKNTNVTSVASARLVSENDNGTFAQVTTYSSAFGFSVFGTTAANFSSVVTSGANSNGLMVGTLTSDPIIVGTNDTERMRIDSSGKTLIGTSTALTATVSGKLQVVASDSTASVNVIRTSSNPGYIAFGSGSSGDNAASGTQLGILRWHGFHTSTYSAAAQIAAEVDGTPGATNDMPGRLIFSTSADGSSSPTERMRIDASGNVGIGLTSFNQKLTIGGINANNNTNQNSIEFQDSNGNPNFRLTGGRGADGNEGYGVFSTLTGGTMTERMRIFSTGEVGIGRTNTSGDLLDVFNGSSSSSVMRLRNDLGGAQVFARFDYGGSIIGSITGNNSATAYNTSSDYRLKENIAPMIGALATVAKLKPVTYDWKAGGSSQGFIAHELAEVVPDCVTGEKDAVDAEGNIKPQGIDTSFLVATLTAAIQELKATVDAQAARIAALESK
jgi:hypothetical protein